MKHVIFSLTPAYAEKIFSGEKTVEFRKKLCAESIERILIYETAPVRRVTGEVSVNFIVSGTPEEIWERLGEKAAMTKRQYDRYYLKRGRAVAYCLSRPVRYERAKELREYGLQSFFYVK